MEQRLSTSGVILLLFMAWAAQAEIQIKVEHNPNEQASALFKFKTIPAPSAKDAATAATFKIVAGERDDNGAESTALHDGKLPSEEDEPESNFFFDAGTEGGRLQVDLGKVISVLQVNTYSWHPDTRGPQIYKLYASDGAAAGFKAAPGAGVDPAARGWKLIASVNTKPKTGNGGGQYGVSISNSQGALGQYRYLLFDIFRTESEDDFGNTFYSEIDVIASDPSATQQAEATPPSSQEHRTQ